MIELPVSRSEIRRMALFLGLLATLALVELIAGAWVFANYRNPERHSDFGFYLVATCGLGFTRRLYVGTYLIGSCIALLIVMATWRRLFPSINFGCCHGCGYDLRGGRSSRCPECGKEVNSKESADLKLGDN